MKVIGIDVSSYQGDIDWKQVEDQGISFAYIKATESTDHLDKKFEQNWSDINDTNIRKGAYLYYDFKKDGKAIAEWFIKNVPVESATLPPAIDFEIDDQTSKNLPDSKKVITNLTKVIDRLNEQYHQTPVLYTNSHTYDTYLKDANLKDKVKFWICDINSNDPANVNKNWEFWQFSWRGLLNGVGGDKGFVDMDLYNGNLADFNNSYDQPFFMNLFN